MTKPIAVSTPADTNEEAAEFRSKLNAICAEAIGGQEWGALSRALVQLADGELLLVPREVAEARGLDALMAALRTVENFVTKGERAMYYQGDDRVKQVNVLRDMAANIRFSSDDSDYPAEERVDYYIGAMRDEGELPDWFDDHDRTLLIRFASDD